MNCFQQASEYDVAVCSAMLLKKCIRERGEDSTLLENLIINLYRTHVTAYPSMTENACMRLVVADDVFGIFGMIPRIEKRQTYEEFKSCFNYFGSSDQKGDFHI